MAIKVPWRRPTTFKWRLGGASPRKPPQPHIGTIMETPSRTIVESFAQAQLEAAVDSYRVHPDRDGLRELRRAVAVFERYAAVVRQQGQCRVQAPFRASLH
jgi:hypothetical protein